MRQLCAILTALICSVTAYAGRPDSVESARAYCDTTSIDAIEGIWQYPDASLTVLVSKSGNKPNHYILTAIEASDASVLPGEEVGTLEPTAAAGTYSLTLMTRRKGGLLTGNSKYTATLADGGYSMTLHNPGITLRLNPLGMLPYVRNLVRLQIDDPRHNVPRGMVKTYPGYDHEGSLPGHPRYL